MFRALLFAASFAVCHSGFGAAVVSTPDAATSLNGSWGGLVEMGKMKIRLVLHFKTEPGGRVVGTMDVPEQGAQGLPVSALLFNHPSVRIEFDQFDAAYNGKLDTSGSNIVGSLNISPRPIDLTFKKMDPSELKPVRTYNFKEGEKKDARGYWKGRLQMGKETMRTNIKIGRLADGKFDARIDLLEAGAMDMPAGFVAISNLTVKLEWPILGITVEGELNEALDKITAQSKQGGRSNPYNLERIDKLQEVLEGDLKFNPTKESEDLAGYWKGVLDTPNAKLRLVLKIGRFPDDSYAGVMKSPDQGSGDILANEITLKAGEAKLEWKRIGGVFTGKLADDGKELKGEWKQGGQPLPLTFQRTTLDQLER